MGMRTTGVIAGDFEVRSKELPKEAHVLSPPRILANSKDRGDTLDAPCITPR